MAVDINSFRLDFPQFEDAAQYSDARIQRALDRAALRIDETVWGTLYDEGLSYLAAYLLSDAELSNVSGGNSVGGMKSASIADEFSATFSEQSSSTTSSSRNMASNRYGAAYLELEHQVVVPLRIC